MNSELDPAKIAELLTISARQLDKATLSALADARQNALKRQSVRKPVFALASASAHGSSHWANRLMPHSAHSWIAAILLVAVFIAGTNYWQNALDQQIDEIDVAILTNDMPIDVFVD
jgi:hypothetical protein